MQPASHHLALSLLTLLILTAIAAVLISPAVPSAPTLLPVSALFVLGIMAMACLVVVRAGWPTLGIFHQARPQRAAVVLDFATGGHPLRR